MKFDAIRPTCGTSPSALDATLINWWCEGHVLDLEIFLTGYKTLCVLVYSTQVLSNGENCMETYRRGVAESDTVLPRAQVLSKG